MRKLLAFLLIFLATFAGADQFTAAGSNATKLRGRSIITTAPGDGQCYVYVAANSDWEPQTCGSGSGTISAGTTNRLPKYTAGTTIGNSLASDDTVTFSYSGTGGISATAGPISSVSDGVHAGATQITGNTTVPTLASNTFSLIAPNSASFTAFGWQTPTAENGSAGVIHVGAASSHISALTISAVVDADLSGQVGVAHGGTNIASGTSGGILGFTGSTTIASSVALTANVLVKGGGAGATPTNSLITDDGTAATYTGTGGYKAPVFVSTGTTAGFIDFPQGTTSAAVAPCNTATSICMQAPTSVTSYLITMAGAAATGIPHYANSSNVITETISAIVAADCPTCVINNAANTGTTAMTLDMSASTTANAFRVPIGAGLTSGANGVIAYDSTAGITHVRTNGADSTIVAATATSTTTTQVLHATAVAGIGAFSAIASGDLPSTVVRTDQANTAGSAMTLDMSGATGAAAFRIPNIAGGTSGSDGVLVYDTTNKNTHVRSNGADALAVVETAALSLNNIPKTSSASLASVANSSLSDNGTTVNSVENYSFGTAGGIPNIDKTIGMLTSAMGSQTTATVTNVTNMTWSVAANKNYVMHCMLPITFAASATIQFAIGGPGTPTGHSINAGPDLGIAGAFGDVSLVNSATYGTKTTASGAVAGTQIVVLDAVIRNGATASGTALTLQTAANGTNAITMLAEGVCSLTQTN